MPPKSTQKAPICIIFG